MIKSLLDPDFSLDGEDYVSFCAPWFLIQDDYHLTRFYVKFDPKNSHRIFHTWKNDVFQVLFPLITKDCASLVMTWCHDPTDIIEANVRKLVRKLEFESHYCMCVYAYERYYAADALGRPSALLGTIDELVVRKDMIGKLHVHTVWYDMARPFHPLSIKARPIMSNCSSHGKRSSHQ